MKKITLIDRKIFWFIFLLLCIGMVFYIYAQHYLEVKKIIEASIQSKNGLNHSSLDYSAIWGAFGDYVGGSLNPIIGLISVFLLFVTWKTTVKTLEQTQEELKESREIQKEMQKTQLLQQFDSFFFPFLAQFKLQENQLLAIQNGISSSELDRIYEKLFGNSECPLAEPNKELKKSHIFNSYFLCLIEMFKKIDNTFLDKKEVAQVYANIVKATMPMRLQQLMALFLSDSQSNLDLFIKYNFFENTSLKVVDTDSLSPLMIAIVQSFNTDMFGNSRNLLDIFGNSKELNHLKKSSTLFENLLTQKSEMIVSGLGVLNNYVLDFSSIIIDFDLGDSIKEFYIIDHKYQLKLTVEKRLGPSLQNSKSVIVQEIYINKIKLDFNMFEIHFFGEKIKISKKSSYYQSQFECEYCVRKENNNNEIIEASSLNVTKKPR